MTQLLMATIEMSLVLLASFVAVAMLRRRSAALRHWILAVGMLCAGATPLLDGVVPAWQLPASLVPWLAPAPAPESRPLTLTSAAIEMPLQSVQTSAPTVPRAIRVDQAVIAVWAAGALLSLSLLIAGALKLRRVASGSSPIPRPAWTAAGDEIASAYGLTRPVTLLQSGHPTLLVTWGILRPKVIFPSVAHAWTDGRIRVVLGHELAHVRRGDWAVLIAGALLRCVWWFNPLVWIACSRLRRESEYACDDVVLRHGVDGAEYATHLLEVARAICRSRDSWIPAPAIAHTSTLEQRIRAMLNDRHNRAPLTPLARAVTSVASLGVAIVVAAAAVTAAAPAPAVSTIPARAAAVDIALPAAPDQRPAPQVSAAANDAPAGGAQTGRGSFSGTLLDQLGGVVPGVDITLTSAATGGTLAKVTDRDGSFEFLNVPAGEYTVRAELPGFRVVQMPVSIAPDAAHRRSIVMSIGSLQETITVIGERGGTAPETPRAQPAPAPAQAADSRQEILREMARRLEASRRQAAAFRAGNVGGVIKAPSKILHVNPIYPAAMQAAGIAGTVSLVSRIGVDGYVVETLEAREADTATPVHPDLVAAAIEAVRQWKFTPTMLNGVPVEVNMSVSVQFSLSQ
jgi:beta-lactamase regulating signal transducer with metallopeptidase domain